MDLGEELYGVVYDRGEVVCQQGEKGDTLFIIQSGAVEVSRRNKDSELVLALLEQGDFFGEMVLLDDFNRSATVKAIRKTRILSLTKKAFLGKLQEDPGVSLHLIQGISRRIENTRELLRKKIEASEPLRWALHGKGLTSEKSAQAGLKKDSGFHDPSRDPVSPEKAPGPENHASSADSETTIPPEFCQTFEPGEVIFRRGQPGMHMYAVINGEVEIGDFSDDLPATRLGPGDFFGQTDMRQDVPYQCDAFAVQKTRVLPINSSAFLDQVRAQPLLALYVLRMQVLKLRLLLAALTDPKETMEVVRRCLPTIFKKQERIRLSVASLSACGGCGAALLDKPDDLQKLLEQVRFVYCPLLMDQSGIAQSELAVVDGVVRVKEDEEKLKEIRSKCRIMVAWGSCATIGGIPSMANRYEIEDLVGESYSDTLDSYAYYLSGSRGFSSIGPESGFLRRAYPIDHFVRVDYYISGCPPNIELLGQLVMEITGEPQNKKPAKIVCAECNRKTVSRKHDHISFVPPLEDEEGVCFLSQGIVCMGSQTLGGCNAECPVAGAPCWGCRGPSGTVLSRLHKGDTTQDVFLKMLYARSRMGEEEIKPIVRLLRTRSNNFFSFQPYLGTDQSRVR